MSRGIAESVAENTTAMMSSQIVTWLSSFVLMLFLPRYLGSEDYGRLFLAISITTITQLFVNFGSYHMITKEISRSRENAPHLIVNSFCIRFVFWAVSMTGLVVFSHVVGYPEESRAVILVLGLSTLWVGAGSVLGSFFRGFEMMKYPSVAAVIERVFVTVVGVGALLLGANSLVIGVIMAISMLLNFLVSLRFALQIVPHFPKFDLPGSIRLIKDGFPYFLSSLFTMVYFRVDAVLMSLMAPAAVVGAYGAAYRFFDMLMFLPFIFSTAVFPVLSRLWIKEEERLVQTTQKSLELITLAAIPVSILVFVFSEQLIKFFFGLKEYAPSVSVLQILGITLILVYLDFILVHTVLASDRQLRWSTVAFVAIPLNILLNYYLIPYTQTQYGNGGLGAAVATFVTETFVMINALTLIPKGILRLSRVGVPLKGVAAGLLMLGTVLLLRGWGVPWIVQALAGMGAYCITVLSMKTLDSSELLFIRSFFSFRNLVSTLSLSREAKL